MTAFLIEIPEENLYRFDGYIHTIDAIIEQLKPPDFQYVKILHTYCTQVRGTNAPPELVTLLTALARGDDVPAVIDKILETI